MLMTVEISPFSLMNVEVTSAGKVSPLFFLRVNSELRIFLPSRMAVFNILPYLLKSDFAA